MDNGASIDQMQGMTMEDIKKLGESQKLIHDVIENMKNRMKAPVEMELTAEEILEDLE